MGLIEVLIVVLLVAWLLGLVVVPIGGSIHLLLVIVLVLVAVRLLQGRSVI